MPYIPKIRDYYFANSHMHQLLNAGKLSVQAYEKWKGVAPDQSLIRMYRMTDEHPPTHEHVVSCQECYNKTSNGVRSHAYNIEHELQDREAMRYEDDITRRWP